MTFKDTPEGSTHYYNDGCGIKEHNMQLSQNPEHKHGTTITPSVDIEGSVGIFNGVGGGAGKSDTDISPQNPEHKHPKRVDWGGARISAAGANGGGAAGSNASQNPEHKHRDESFNEHHDNGHHEGKDLENCKIEPERVDWLVAFDKKFAPKYNRAFASGESIEMPTEIHDWITGLENIKAFIAKVEAAAIEYGKEMVEGKLYHRAELLEQGRQEGEAEFKQFMLNILDGVDEADRQMGQTGGGTKAIRFAIQSRFTGTNHQS